MKPPAWAKLFTPDMKNPKMNSTSAHCPYCRRMRPPNTPPRFRPYATMAPNNPKMAPDAPIVNGTPTRLEATKPSAPDTVKITTRRAGPNISSTAGPS